MSLVYGWCLVCVTTYCITPFVGWAARQDSEIIPCSDLLGATAAATTRAPDFYWVYMFQNMIARWLGFGCINVLYNDPP